MKPIIDYIKQFIYTIDKRILVLVSVLSALLIFLNYNYGIEKYIGQHYSFSQRFLCWYGIFLLAFALPYLLCRLLQKKKYIAQPRFLVLLFLAPAIFSLKISLDIPLHFMDNANWNNYWNHVFYWPLLVIITTSILFIIWKIVDTDQPFYGIKTKGMNWKPYGLMLLIMLPLVAAASTQPDFLAVYPKIKTIAGVYHEQGIHWWHKLLFELSYGSDFITIELFFRGFLILAFIKWAGKDAILPMACFYCTIHFGKPLGECISSYFGGMILGIIVYNTRSILGGLMVHLGVAWMMELGGYIGNGW